LDLGAKRFRKELEPSMVLPDTRALFENVRRALEKWRDDLVDIRHFSVTLVARVTHELGHLSFPHWFYY
jgi:hypothetical protein